MKIEGVFFIVMGKICDSGLDLTKPLRMIPRTCMTVKKAG